ncbi:MAG: glycosyltransferase family 2 protein [Candidatus Poribacteria bacterium]
MINGKKLVVVMPAYNAAKTLQKTFDEIPRDIVDEVILTDDGSSDKTVNISKNLGITTFRPNNNRGYGGNQKTCYKNALGKKADIVVMVHPDYQYTPLLITAMASMIAHDIYDIVLGSRILGKTALSGGMPVYKYFFNRVLTFSQNIIMNQKLSEYHTGYRAFSRKVLETLPLEENSDDFVFDNQMLTQSVYFGFRIGEVSCPTKYFTDSSSINFRRSVKYGIGCLANSVLYRMARSRLLVPKFLSKKGQRKE